MGWGGGGWWGGFFSDYRVSPNFLVVLGLRLWLRLGLGCDKTWHSSYFACDAVTQ